MPNGTQVLINGKTLGVIKLWNEVRQQYLVEIQETMQCQYISEKHLTK